MTSTLTRTSQAVAEWSKVFPRQAVETYTSSVTFMKQLTMVAVSTITYLKNTFSEDNYMIDQFGGLKIRVLKNKCDDELAQFLISSLTQAFEAFDKKYLHQIALCFYEERCCPDNLIEYHLFEYGYGAGTGGASLNVRSGGRGAQETVVTLDALRDRTVQLLRACMVMLSNNTLPESYDVSIRLYYNDDAPDGYQVPGFSTAADSWPDEVLATAGAARVKLGSVHTPFHRLQLHTHHRDMRTTESDNTSVLSQEPNELTSNGQATAAGQVPDEGGAGGAEDAEGAGEKDTVRCECGRDDKDTVMLLCSGCGALQHATCYGVRVRGRAGRTAHWCVRCAGRAGSSALLDQGLLRSANRVCYAIFRRALAWLSEGESRVSACDVSSAMALNAVSARKLMRVLKAHGVIATEPPADPNVSVEVISSQLEAALTRYFRTPPPSGTDDLASRLLEQSQCSEPSDPLTEVLSPMERVSLQATGSTAVIVEPVALLDKQDSTLEQYRSALAPLDPNKSPAAILSPRRKRKQNGRAPGVKTKKMRKGSKD